MNACLLAPTPDGGVLQQRLQGEDIKIRDDVTIVNTVKAATA